MSSRDDEIVAGGVRLKKDGGRVEVEFLELYAEVHIIRVSDGIDVIVKRDNGEITGFWLEGAKKVYVCKSEEG